METYVEGQLPHHPAGDARREEELLASLRQLGYRMSSGPEGIRLTKNGSIEAVLSEVNQVSEYLGWDSQDLRLLEYPWGSRQPCARYQDGKIIRH